MKEFSNKWKSSKKPKKQRKYLANAPLHKRKKFLSTHLSKELKEKYGKRNIPLRTGDSVKILRGQFKKRVGKITKIDLKNTKVFIEGIENLKRDGTKSSIPIAPSNLVIEKLNLDDKKRKIVLERK